MLKDIQKVFENISSNFVLAYTAIIMKSEQLKRSYCFEPILHESYMFYQDFYYKDFRKIKESKKKSKKGKKKDKRSDETKNTKTDDDVD